MIYSDYINKNYKKGMKVDLCRECGNAPDICLETSPYTKIFICLDCANQLKTLITEAMEELKRKVELYK